MALPIPYVWHVTGKVTLPNGSPFNQGIIRAFDVLNNQEHQLGETGFNQSGQYTITYSSANFQLGNVNRTAPNLLVRIFDYQNRILWQSQIISNAQSEQSLNIVLDGGPTNDIWEVYGCVKYSDGKPLTSGAVVVLDKLNTQTFELGRSPVDINGNYTVSFSRDCFQRGDPTRLRPNLVLLVQDADDKLLKAVEAGAPASQKENISITIPGDSPSQPQQPNQPDYRVFGTVVNRLGFALSGKLVKASCLDFHTPQGFSIIPLGTATTDSKGAYSITYDPTPLPNTSTPTDSHGNLKGNAIYAELRYYTKSSNGTEVEAFTSSPLIFHAATPQQIDFTFDEEATSSVSEYVDLDAALGKYATAILQESLKHPGSGSTPEVPYTDVEKLEAFLESTARFPYVVDREGLSEDKVRAYFLARKLVSEFTESFAAAGYVAGNYTEYFYGLVRAGSGTGKDELLKLQPTEIHDRLVTAISSSFISSACDIETFLEIWKKLLSDVDRYVTDTDFGMYNMLVMAIHGKVDNDHPLTSAEKARIKNLLGKFFDAAGDSREFLSLTRPQTAGATDPLSQAEWTKLEFILDLCDFSESNYDLVVAAFEYCEAITPDGPRSLKDLTGLSDDQWGEIVVDTSILYCNRSNDPQGSLPPEFPGANPAEQRAIYVIKLSKKIIEWFKQDSVVIDLPDQIAALIPGTPGTKWQEVATFLTDVAVDYDLDSTNLDAYLKEHPSIVISTDAHDALQAIQRVYRLTTDVKAVAYLLTADPPLNAANLIANYDEDQFLADHCVGLGGMEKARQIYRIAVNYISELTGQIANYHSNLNIHGESIPAIPRGLTASPRIENLAGVNTTVAKPRTPARVVPNWTSLFGVLNQQMSTNGQSILSPSAYLVDLLEYLKGSSLDLFLSRRYDLLGLQLTKQNAETPLPTIDLVIELLEALAAQASSIPSYQTTMEAADLRAEPQNTNTFPEAYENLANQYYPSSLPVNFPREQARMFLEKCSLSWKHLALALDKNSRRILIVDPGLRDALIGSKDVWTLWGLDEQNNSILRPNKVTMESGSWDEILSVAAIFLDRSGLTMQEFLDLLATETFKDFEIIIESDGIGFQEGDINRFSIHGITSDFAMTVSRFLRCQRLLGWTLEEIDEAWGASLDELDIIQDLHLTLGTPVLEVLAWGQSLQKKLFEKTFMPPIDNESLYLAYSSLSMGNDTILDIDSFSRWMCSRLKITRAEFDLVLDYLDINHENTLWTKQNLEDMYRVQSFARSLKLSIADFLKLSDWLDLELGSNEWSWSGCRNCSEKLELLKSTSIPMQTWVQLAFPPDASMVKEGTKFLKALGASLDTLRNQFNIPTPSPSDLESYVTALGRCIEILKIEGADKIESLASVVPTDEKELAAWKDNLTSWLNNLNKQKFLDDNAPSNIMKAATPEGRLELLFNALLPFVTAMCSDAVEAEIKTQLTAQFAIPEEVCNALLKNWLNSVFPSTVWPPALIDWTALTAASAESSIPAFCLFSKASTLVKALEIETADVLSLWMPVDKQSFLPRWNVFSFNSTTTTYLDTLRPLIQIIQVVEGLGYQKEGYIGLSDRELLESRLDLRSSDLDALLTECKIIDTSAPSEIDLSNIENWARFLLVLELFRKCYTYPDTLKALLQPVENNGMSDYTNQVNTLRNCLAASMTPEAWREFVQPVNDELRKRKRDALAAYVCWRSQKDSYYPQEFFDCNDLYAYYLIDVEMEPDMAVSRILQALLSIQQFVQRGLMGLEGRFTLSDKQKEQWEWMKNYRVWEANRKVFLYAENWIEPELRDDKTPFFKELEEKILQSADTANYPEEAVAEYVDKLREVSNLEIVGVCKEVVKGGNGKYILHIVGRTRGTPYTFYYRRYLGNTIYKGEWTSWEKIDAEISSLIVIPALLDNRLYLAWPQYVRNEEQSNSTTTQSITVGSTQHQAKTEIRMEWIHYDGKKWSGKKTSKSVLTDQSLYSAQHKLADGELIGDRYHFQTQDESLLYLKVNIFRTWYDWKTETTMCPVQVTSGTTALQSKSVRTEYDDNQYIGEFGYFKIWADGRDEAAMGENQDAVTDTDPDIEIQNHITGGWIGVLTGNFKIIEKSTSDSDINVGNYPPSRFKLKHNFWVDDSTSNYLAPFIIPKGNTILFQTPNQVRLMPVNFSFYKGEKLPFFFMDSTDTFLVLPSGGAPSGNQNYKFEIVSHPIANTFHGYLKTGGLKQLYTRETQALPVTNDYYNSYSYAYYYSYYSGIYLGYYIAGDWHAWDVGQNMFKSQYLPNWTGKPFPVPVVDFNWGSSFGIYNWELFFHIPMLLAGKLSQQQRFQEAMDWYHLVFDPRIDLSIYERTKRWAQSLPQGARFWKFLPFFANRDADESISGTLGMPTDENSVQDQEALKSLIAKWKDDPFNPHLIARNRLAAYQKNVVMKYLDNLIAWADQLFMTDTSESINEAVQLYILAANILGSRAAEVPDMVEKKPLTAQEILDNQADDLGNVLINLENQMITTNADVRNVSQSQPPVQIDRMLSISGSMFYFSIPRNDKLLGYWDTVADRLYKIRNSLNFEGIKRVLALYAPPIDPGLLVRAKAAGLDLGAVLSGTNAPLPYYRFQTMLQKALDIAREVQSLGNNLMSTLEKKDGEALSLLRTKNEEDLLQLNHAVRKLQIDEANVHLETLQKNKETVEARQKFYREIEKVSSLETAHISMVGTADKLSLAASVASLAGSVSALIPDFNVGAVVNCFGGPSFSSNVGGGEKISKVSSFISQGLQIGAQIAHSAANLIQINAGYDRRWADWKLQETLATKELASLEKQIVAAEIRIHTAEKELSNLEKQIEQVDEVYTFMKTRFTNQDLFNWLATQLSQLYTTSYKLALDVAKRAEQCYRFEMGLDNDSTPSIIQTNHWDGLHKGLLAGERLLADLRRLETSYMDKNKREMEITKPVSLATLNPSALRDLQKDGICQIDIPEVLFDLDFPGHYFRRIKAVRLEIPCTAGPYTSISAKLTLLNNKLRPTSVVPSTGYADTTFVENRVGVQSIATCQAQNDAGVFELNFHDERYLPFEGAGAVSAWRLELPKEYRQFDYSSIADVILHISYTAREGGDRLKKAAFDNIQTALNAYEAIKGLDGLVAEIRLGCDFNDNLQQLRAANPTTIQVDDRCFPTFVGEKKGKLQGVRIFAYPQEGKSIDKLKLKANLTDTAEVTKNFDSMITAPSSDNSILKWDWTDGDDDLLISGSWTFESGGTDKQSLQALASLGELVIELRYSIMKG